MFEVPRTVVMVAVDIERRGEKARGGGGGGRRRGRGRAGKVRSVTVGWKDLLIHERSLRAQGS